MIDVGKYLVIAENVAGKDETSCEAFILNTANVDDRSLVDPQIFRNLERVPDIYDVPQEQSAQIGKPPKFIVHLPNEIKLNDGESIYVNCKVEGYPYPKV
jgi:hypothetical protein